MPDRIEVNRKARTTRDITGMVIDTIPAGTEFIVTWYQEYADPSRTATSMAKGLSISIVYNDEFEFIN